jgi:hypothetical protein
MWFAFKGSGSVYNLNGFAEKQLVLTGAHGYPTRAQAVAHPNAAANGLQAGILAEFQAEASSPAGGGAVGVQQGTTAAVTPGSFLGVLNSSSLWQRVAEVAIGGILLVVAVKGMIPSGVQQGAAKAVSTVKQVKPAGWFT